MVQLELGDPRIHSLIVNSHGVSERGTRPTNQDCFLIAELPPLPTWHEHLSAQRRSGPAVNQTHLFLVADGMGKRGGQIASTLAAQTVKTTLLHSWESLTGEEENEAIARVLQKAVQAANRTILAETRRQPLHAGMGTTLTVALLVRDQVHLAHAGDSRCFLYRNERLYQLTHDDTLGAEMLRAGEITAAELATHPLRAVLTNVVGGKQSSVQVEVNRLPIRPKDWLLLCTDGVTEVLRDGEMTAILRAARDPEQACTDLLARVQRLNGEDNMTVVAVELGLSD